MAVVAGNAEPVRASAAPAPEVSALVTMTAVAQPAGVVIEGAQRCSCAMGGWCDGSARSKPRFHSMFAREAVAMAMSDLVGVAGVVMLGDCELGDASALRVKSLREAIANAVEPMVNLGGAATQNA